jgi:hypothetical protein
MDKRILSCTVTLYPILLKDLRQCNLFNWFTLVDIPHDKRTIKATRYTDLHIVKFLILGIHILHTITNIGMLMIQFPYHIQRLWAICSDFSLIITTQHFFILFTVSYLFNVITMNFSSFFLYFLNEYYLFA